MITKFLDLYPETKVTYINKKIDKKWTNWKTWKDCNVKEKEEINLRQIFPNEILLDIEEKENKENIQKMLDEKGYNYILCDTGSRGIHFHL